MQFKATITIFAASLACAVTALGIDDTDVPSICLPICRPLIQLSEICDEGSSTNQDCMCKNTSFDVVNLGSLCYICCEQSNSLRDDLRSISDACGFTQGPYAQASATSLAGTAVVIATRPGSNEVVTMSAPVAATGTGSSSGNAAPAPTMPPAHLLAGAGAVVAGLML